MKIDAKNCKQNISKTISIINATYHEKGHIFQKYNIDLLLENHVFCPFNRVKKKNHMVISIKVGKTLMTFNIDL